jgi:uncharacterized protein DUF2459
MPRRRFACACLGLTLLTGACAVPWTRPSEGAFVYVIERGWHTDIGLPVQEIAGPLATLEGGFPGVRVLTFGFGERQFLVNRKTNLGTMLIALLPSRSLLLVTALRTTPEVAFGPSNVVALPISRAGLEKIEASIWQELENPDTGALAEGPYLGSVFYAARDTYDMLFTCNTWTAETLRVGGLPIPATGVVFAEQVMGMARWIGARHVLP